MTLRIPERVNSSRIALIDGDILAYRCGFAGQQKVFDLYWIDPHTSGKRFVDSFSSKADMYDWITAEEKEEADEDTIFELGYYFEEDLLIDKLENVLHSVKLQIDFILEQTNSGSHIIYLTDEDSSANFRSQVAVSKPYKGSRKSGKPHWYKEIRQYLIDRWGTTVITGMEADDAMAIDQYEALHLGIDTVICTLDKDLDMVEGWHYNFVKDEMYWVFDEDAWRNFFTQLIVGDTVDNIPGMPGGGTKLAAELSNMTCPYEMFSYVRGCYSIKGLENEYMDEQATLLWMLRDPEDSWKKNRSLLETLS